MSEKRTFEMEDKFLYKYFKPNQSREFGVVDPMGSSPKFEIENF